MAVGGIGSFESYSILFSHSEAFGPLSLLFLLINLTLIPLGYWVRNRGASLLVVAVPLTAILFGLRVLQVLNKLPSTKEAPYLMGAMTLFLLVAMLVEIRRR